MNRVFFLVLCLVLSGCFDVPAQSRRAFKAQSMLARNQGSVLQPGEVGAYLERFDSEKLRYVVYRTLEAQRERLRGSQPQWSHLDLVALVESAEQDRQADYQPLRAVANAHLIWARLEGFKPGSMAGLLRGADARKVVGWILNLDRPARPAFEHRLSQGDLASIQGWAMERLPGERLLLRWTFEQEQGPGQVAGFLSRDWTDQQRVEILRMWCTSEGWSPISTSGELTAPDNAAIRASLDRLDRSIDPLVRREVRSWRRWIEARG